MEVDIVVISSVGLDELWSFDFTSWHFRTACLAWWILRAHRHFGEHWCSAWQIPREKKRSIDCALGLTGSFGDRQNRLASGYRVRA